MYIYVYIDICIYIYILILICTCIYIYIDIHPPLAEEIVRSDDALMVVRKRRTQSKNKKKDKYPSRGGDTVCRKHLVGRSSP